MLIKQGTELFGLLRESTSLLKETLLLMQATGITPVEALGLLRDLLLSIREREELLDEARHAEHPKWLYEQGI